MRNLWFSSAILAALLSVAANTLALAQAATGDLAAVRLQPIQGPLQLNPDQAAQLAVERSTDQALARASVDLARGALRQADAIDGWQASLDATYIRQGPAASITIDGNSIPITAIKSDKETLTVSKPLYLSGRDRYARQGALSGVKAATSYLAAGVISVSASARQAVYGTLRLQQLAAVTQEHMTAVAEHLRLTQAMNEQGTVARFEVVQAETDLASVRGDVIAAQTAISQQRAALAQVLNVPQGTEMSLTEGAPVTLPSEKLPDLIAEAFKTRPELQALEHTVAAADANLRIARANDRLSVALQGTVSEQTSTAFSQSMGWNVAVAVTQPLYQGGATQAKIMQAEANLQSAKLNLEKAQQQIALQVNQALLSVQEARSTLAVAEQGEVNARERQRIAQVRFQNGVSLGVEVLDAQTALASAQTQVINSRYALQTAVTNLRAALGYADLPKESSR